MRVARIEPERLVRQIGQHRDIAVARKGEPMRKPAVTNEKAHELQRRIRVLPSREYHSAL